MKLGSTQGADTKMLLLSQGCALLNRFAGVKA